MVTPSQERYSRTKHDAGRIIRDQKLFSFEKRLNGLACIEMAQREYHGHMEVWMTCRRELETITQKGSDKYPMEFSAANFKQSQVNRFF